MAFLLDMAVTAISLVFLAIVLFVAGAAIPGLFMPVAAPILEKIVPARKKR